MKKATVVGLCTTLLLFGLLSFILAFLAEGENIQTSSNSHECEKHKMKAFKLGIASTTTLLCTQLYAIYVFDGCCQCKEIGLDVNIFVRLFSTLTWIVATVDFGFMMDTSLKVKYRLEDKRPGENLCGSEKNKFNVVKLFPILGLISVVVALMNIISFVLIYKWTEEPIPEKNTLLNVVPNMIHIEERLYHEERDDVVIERNGDVVIVRRYRAVVYWRRIVRILGMNADDLPDRNAAAPPPPSHGRKTKRIVHCAILLLLCVGSSTLAFLAEVKNIKHSYLHGDCREMKTAALKLGFASAAMLLFSFVYYLAIMGRDGLRHYNDLSKFFYLSACILTLISILLLAFNAWQIKSKLNDIKQPLKELCPVNKGHTLRLRIGFSVAGLLILVVLLLEVITYNYVQVRPPNNSV